MLGFFMSPIKSYKILSLIREFQITAETNQSVSDSDEDPGPKAIADLVPN